MSSGPRTITILHFNDCYEIEARKVEPVGGAARMAAKIKSFGPNALLLHSGDAYNPSMLSTITQGKQMVEVLNSCGVKAACVGNHDLDYGVENFKVRAAECSFPWLMANILEAESGVPLGGAAPTALLDWQGVKVGLIGLVEYEWLETLGSVEPDEVRYLDFVAEGQRLAAELRAQGAEVVVALTHMRLPNDLRLAGEAPGIDLVLGGHDHDCFLVRSEPHGTAVVKSGTDFRYLTEIQITLSPSTPHAAAAAATAAPANAAEAGASPVPTLVPGAGSAGAPELAGAAVRPAMNGTDSRQAAAAASASAAPPPEEATQATSLVTTRPAGGGSSQGGAGTTVTVRCARHSITADVAESAEVAAIVEKYRLQMGERLDVVVGSTATDLDGRFASVRTGESNLGNFMCDVWRQACRCDAALLNGGTLRSDRVHPAGQLTHRDLLAILPMLDGTVVIEVTGSKLLEALENGVSMWPKHEGRFPQVSGIRFAFDPSKPPGHRIVAGSVMVGSQPLQPEKRYSLATKQYLADGKDGYDALEGSQVIRDCDATPMLPCVIVSHFLLLRTINCYVENTGQLPAWRRAAERLLNKSESYSAKQHQRLQREGVSHIGRKHPATGRWEIAPVVDGRIKRVGGGPDINGQPNSAGNSAAGMVQS